jgi:hypothetical protein
VDDGVVDVATQAVGLGEAIGAIEAQLRRRPGMNNSTAVGDEGVVEATSPTKR